MHHWLSSVSKIFSPFSVLLLWKFKDDKVHIFEILLSARIQAIVSSCDKDLCVKLSNEILVNFFISQKWNWEFFFEFYSYKFYFFLILENFYEKIESIRCLLGNMRNRKQNHWNFVFFLFEIYFQICQFLLFLLVSVLFVRFVCSIICCHSKNLIWIIKFRFFEWLLKLNFFVYEQQIIDNFFSFLHK